MCAHVLGGARACLPRGGARPPPARTAHEAHTPHQALQQMLAATGGRGRPVHAAVGPWQPTRPAHPTSPGSGLRVRSSASACGLGSSAGMACGCTSASAAARSSNSASRAVSLRGRAGAHRARCCIAACGRPPSRARGACAALPARAARPPPHTDGCPLPGPFQAASAHGSPSSWQLAFPSFLIFQWGFAFRCLSAPP